MPKPMATFGQRVTVYLPHDAPTRFLSSVDRDNNPFGYAVQEYTLTVEQAARLLADLQAAVL